MLAASTLAALPLVSSPLLLLRILHLLAFIGLHLSGYSILVDRNSDAITGSGGGRLGLHRGRVQHLLALHLLGPLLRRVLSGHAVHAHALEGAVSALIDTSHVGSVHFVVLQLVAHLVGAGDDGLQVGLGMHHVGLGHLHSSGDIRSGSVHGGGDIGLSSLQNIGRSDSNALICLVHDSIGQGGGGGLGIVHQVASLILHSLVSVGGDRGNLLVGVRISGLHGGKEGLKKLQRLLHARLGRSSGDGHGAGGSSSRLRQFLRSKFFVLLHNVNKCTKSGCQLLSQIIQTIVQSDQLVRQEAIKLGDQFMRVLVSNDHNFSSSLLLDKDSDFR